MYNLPQREARNSTKTHYELCTSRCTNYLTWQKKSDMLTYRRNSSNSCTDLRRSCLIVVWNFVTWSQEHPESLFWTSWFFVDDIFRPYQKSWFSFSHASLSNVFTVWFATLTLKQNQSQRTRRYRKMSLLGACCSVTSWIVWTCKVTQRVKAFATCHQTWQP